MSTLKPGMQETEAAARQLESVRQLSLPFGAGVIELTTKGFAGKLDKIVAKAYNQGTARNGEGQVPDTP